MEDNLSTPMVLVDSLADQFIFEDDTAHMTSLNTLGQIGTDRKVEEGNVPAIMPCALKVQPAGIKFVHINNDDQGDWLVP